MDRHRPSFLAVLDYYRTGLLRRPDEIPLDVMINELKFYRLDEIAIEDFLKSECILKSGFLRILAMLVTVVGVEMCWRQNVLVTTVGAGCGHFSHQHPLSFIRKRRAPTFQRCHQD